MRAINHALTGSLIGLAIAEPVIAVPLAFLSHYALDAIPHSGVDMNQKKYKDFLSGNLFRYTLYADAVACIVLVIIFALARPLNWFLACICAFLAASPDFFSFNRWRKAVDHKKFKASAYSKFASGIQWFERPSGIVVEIVWFIGVIILLRPFFR